MSAATVTSSGLHLQPTQQAAGLRYYMRQFEDALKNNDLTAAQTAYTHISELPQFRTARAQGNSFLQHIAAIGEDVMAGNLDRASAAFSSLQSAESAETAPSEHNVDLLI